jgi:ribonuclease VapC
LQSILEEPGYNAILDKIAGAEVAIIGAPTLLEAAMVLSVRRGNDVRALLTMSLRQFQIEVVPFTEEHFDIAAEAFFRSSKGHHPAALNFGDCMSYAIASLSGLPLLYTGNDFAHSDIQSA